MGGAEARPLPANRRVLLEEYLRSRGEGARVRMRAVPRRDRGETVPLSLCQELVWLHAQLAPDVPVYNEAVTIHYDGPLDEAALERSLREIVARHEAWRTGFEVRKGTPVQVVHDTVSVELPRHDLRPLEPGAREAEATRLATADATRPIALDRPPLFRARLVRVAEERYRLYLTLSHIIFDGVAIVDRPRPAVFSFRGSMHPFVIEEGLARRLRDLARQHQVTLFQVLLAAFAAQLSRYSGQDDIPIGSVTSGRDVPGTEKLLGYFLRTIVLRLDLSGGITFRDLLQRAREVTLEGLSHDSLPFGTLLTELGATRDPGLNPLFQVLFSLEPPLPPLPPAWRLTQMDVDTGATKYDLYLELDDRSDVVLARFHYSTDLFDRTTVARKASELITLLDGAAAAPGTMVRHLPLLPAEERRLILHSWNATEHPYPGVTVHELFEAQAHRTPDAIAVECGITTLTYAELDGRANQLAHHLRSLGVRPDDLVACCMHRSPDLIVGLLAILKAGGAYLPLDPAHPKARLEQILASAIPRVALTTRELAPLFPPTLPVLALDAEREAVERQPRTPERRRAGTRNLAYVIATSGSTGAPKGVAIEHRSVVNHLAGMQRELAIGATDAVAGLTTVSFDIAGLEIHLPLATGARIVIVPGDLSRDGVALARFLDERRPTLIQATPSSWRMLVEAGWRGGPDVALLCGGEPMPRGLAAQLSARCRVLWNCYGPTETTIWSLLQRVDPGEDGPVPIGRPMANTRVYLLDRHGEPVPIGVVGDLHIGGDGVARGYRHREDLTRERFRPDPFVPRDGARLYRTGDLARYRADGRIDFLGRNDRQVKIRGHRIELGEIEAVLSGQPGVAAAAVDLREAAPGDGRLVAYVAGNGDRGTPHELRDRLRERLPDVMVPSQFVFLDEMPLTPNGKVDRRRLPDPGGVTASASRYAEPRSDLEARLAAMWEELLGVRPVGIHDDFFALGGHSLLAVRLFSAIEHEFGSSVPLATLLRAPTVARLAQVIEGGGEPARFTSLVPIQPEGSLPPLFCVHGHFGEVLFYRPLSERLGDAQPFHALAAAPLSGRGPVHRTIEEMAGHYLSEVRQVRQHGPYALAGYCLGSLVAFEMALQLVRDGEKVSFLGLFMGYDRPDPWGRMLWNKVRRHVGRLRRDGPRKEAGVVARETARKVSSALWQAAYARLGARVPRIFLRNVPEMNLQAARRYVGEPYPGRITVFLSGAPPGFVFDPVLDLYGLEARRIDLRLVPGDRDSMMREPSVAVLARELRECLAEAAEKCSREIVP